MVAKKFKANEIIVIENVEKMPEEAELEKEVLLEQGIKSLIALPLIYNDKLMGYLGLDNTFKNKVWDDDCKFLLKMASEIFLGVFARLEYEKQFQSINKVLGNKEKDISS